MRAIIGIGGLQRNVENILRQFSQQQEFTLVEQPSLLSKNWKKKKRPWRIVSQIWKSTNNIDLYYGISYGQWLRYLIAYWRGKPTICHWAGTDVWRIQNIWFHRLWFHLVIRHCITLHLAVSEPLKESLEQVGIKAKLVPLISDLSQAEVVSLPKKFTILAYLPAERSAFYRADIIYMLAKRHPEWHFLIVGREPTQEGFRLENVTELGANVDMNKVYPYASVLVRTPQHDGLSRMVIEALCWGRNVLYSQQFPHTIHADSIASVEEQLSKLANTNQPNHAGSIYVRQTYSDAAVVEQLTKAFRNVLA